MASQTRLSLDDVLRALDLPAEGDSWRATWEKSAATFRVNEVEFLRPAWLNESCDWLGITGELREALRQSATMFANNPPMQRLAWHCHWLIFLSGRALVGRIHLWPKIPSSVRGLAELFYPVVLLGGLPHIRKLHREHGVSEEITRDTVSDLALWLNHFHQLDGAWSFRNLGWLVNHFTGRLYKLGRLQFCLDTFQQGFRAFRNRRDGRVELLAPHGKKFRADGQFDGANQVFEPDAREAVYQHLGGEIRGCRVSADGRVLRETVTFPAGDWERVLHEGDATLGVHIPATGPMDFARCGESFRRAIEFFPKHFPEHRFRAFTCTSWLLDDQLGDYLSSESNIVRFQREFYLHPVEGANDRQTFERVFWRRFENIDDAPRDTSVRRAIVAHVKAGGYWRLGGGLIFPEDLRWGGQVYRATLTAMRSRPSS